MVEPKANRLRSLKSWVTRVKMNNPWKNVAPNKPVSVNIKYVLMNLPMPTKKPITTENMMLAGTKMKAYRVTGNEGWVGNQLIRNPGRAMAQKPRAVIIEKVMP